MQVQMTAQMMGRMIQSATGLAFSQMQVPLLPPPPPFCFRTHTTGAKVGGYCVAVLAIDQQLTSNCQQLLHSPTAPQ
jgi:hypothetical protein